MSKGFLHYPPRAIRYPLSAVLAITLGLAACAPKGEALYSRANEAMAKGDTRAAVIDLKNLVKDEPQNAKARALLGQALLQSGNVQAATIEVQKAKDLGATADVLLVPDCLLMSAKGEFDKVLAGCDPATAPDAAKFQLRLAQGRALMGLDRAGDAKAQFTAALASRPDSVDALLGLAGAVSETEGLPAAKAVLDKAPESIRKGSTYWMTMGGISMQGGDFAAAEKSYQTAVDRAGKGAEAGERLAALGAMAESQMRQGKVKEAEATTDVLIKAAPDNPLVKQLRGQVAAAAGKYDEARTLLEEAVAAMPDNHQARLMLGMVNLQQGNVGLAEMHFANVVTNQPGNVRAQRLLAETRARSQTPEQTLASMQPALAQETADPSLLAMAGRLSMASGNREQALSYLARATGQPSTGQSPDVQLEIAGGYLMAGDNDRAIELLEAMPQGGATGYQREYLLMAALLRKGEKDKAVEEGKALVARSGDDPAVRNLVAAVFAAAGQKDSGREQLNAALKLKPADPQTLTNLARLDLAEGKTADAEARFRKVLEADPKNLVATMGIAAAAGARGDNDEAEKWLQKAVADHPESVDTQMALAQFYLGTQQFGKAKATIDAVAKKSPDNAALSNASGLVSLGLKDVPGAIANFRMATEQAPMAHAYSLNLARAHLVNKDLKGALDVLNGVLRADPKYLPALVLAAAGSLQAGDVEKATGYVVRLKQAAPEAPSTYTLEGDLAMAQKRYMDALDNYREASAKGTDRALVYAQYRAGMLAGAAQPEKVLEDWVSAHPEDAGVVAVLADDRQRRGDSAGAIKLYQQVLEKAPGNPVLLNNLAVLYQVTGNPQALETAEKAHNAAPKSAAIQDTYGWLLYEKGQTGKAVALLADAYKGMPDNAVIQYHYAAALAKSGKTAEAVPLLKKALSGELPPESRADAQRLLQQRSK